jgi:hypothetical protein
MSSYSVISQKRYSQLFRSFGQKVNTMLAVTGTGSLAAATSPPRASGERLEAERGSDSWFDQSSRSRQAATLPSRVNDGGRPEMCPPRPVRGAVGTGNSPQPYCAVAKAGVLPERGRKAPHIGSLRHCLPVIPAGNPFKVEPRLLLAAPSRCGPGGTMTQLACPDLARNRLGRDHVRPGPASAATEALPADRSGFLRAGRPVPGWTVGTALLAPAVLVGGWLVAGALQPPSYSPMRQTISVLAGYSGTDRWVMTTALLVVGSCQIATGAGLTAVRIPARILLILTGLSTLGIAATPEPATGPTSRHLAFAVSCVVTTAVWPVLVARRAPAQSWILSLRSCATVTVLFAALSCWLLIAAQDSSGDLGTVERLTSAAQGLFPLVVALALRRTARDADNQGQRRQERSRRQARVIRA